LGQDIRVRLPEGELSGRFDGLDEAGRLLLNAAGARVSVTAGEVFGFGSP
jgi:BirA family biotin operon repressor/biotin-[acetyl-CoA-carboxylase] ligase